MVKGDPAMMYLWRVFSLAPTNRNAQFKQGVTLMIVTVEMQRTAKVTTKKYFVMRDFCLPPFGIALLLGCTVQVYSQVASISVNWTWHGRQYGSTSDTAVYGAKGQFSPSNSPGSLNGARAFYFNNSFYLFGRNANIMWQYRSSDNLWGWISGANWDCSTCASGCGQYGKLRKPNATNIPPSRSFHQAWLVNSVAYMFGGQTCGNEAKDDLWSYNISSNIWTWISGSSSTDFAGNYSQNFSPSGRFCTAGFDAYGSLYLFAGTSYLGVRNDLWMFDLGSYSWTFLKGSSVADQGGMFFDGPDPENSPNPVTSPQIWFSQSTNRSYVFGGFTNSGSLVKAMYFYEFSSQCWQVVGGTSQLSPGWKYGPKGEFGASLYPPPRYEASTWSYYSNHGTFLMMYGGSGDLETNNIWTYWEENEVWAWISGSSGLDTGTGFGAQVGQYDYPQWGNTFGQFGLRSDVINSFYYFSWDNNLWSFYLNVSRCSPGSFSANTSGYVCQYCSPGLFAANANQTTCQPCNSGSYASSLGHSACVLCTLGTFTSNASTPCSNCPFGRISAVLGANACEQCTAGRYSNSNLTRTACLDCAAGYVSVVNGSTSCSLCPSGKFSSAKSSQCTSCPTHAITSSEVSISPRDCVCPEGFFGNGNDTCNQCVITVGIACPYNSSVPFIKAGWYRKINSNVSEVIACVPPEACPEGGYGSTVCADGYDGRGCLQCADRFFRIGLKCLPCLNTAGRWSIISMLFLLAVFACWKLTQAHGRIPVVVRISFSWLQVLSLFALISSNWPKSLAGLFDVSSFLNGEIQLFGFNCDKFTFWSVWLLKLFVPIPMFLVLGVFNFLSAVKQNKRVSGTRVISEKLPAMLYSLTLLSTMVYNAIFQVFYCTEVKHGEWVLVSDPAVKCYDASWNRYLVIDILAMIVYVAFLPLFAFFYIKSRVKNQSDVENLKMIISPYKQGLEYWEIVKLGYKLIFILLRNVGGFDPVVKQFVLFLALVIQLHLDSKICPYKRTDANDISNM
jgi:hypothetical protein